MTNNYPELIQIFLISRFFFNSWGGILICPLSSRQVKYLKLNAQERPQQIMWSFFYAHHFFLYFSIRLFFGIGYFLGLTVVNASVRTSKGVLHLYLSCGRSSA